MDGNIAAGFKWTDKIKNLPSRLTTIQVKSSTVALVILYIVMVIFFSMVSPYYFTVSNFLSIFSNLGITGIVAIGMMVVMLAGGFDLSVGSMVGLVGVFIARMFNIAHPPPLPVIILIGMLIGPALGAINGIIITRVGINPLIATLGTMAIFRGFCYIYAMQVARIYDPIYLALGRSYLFKYIPISFLYMVLLMLLMDFILRYTRFGRNVFAVGGNVYAARAVGINTDRVKFYTYVISGIMCSFAAVILTAQLGMGRPEFGTGYELEIITALALGGVSLSGGKGDFIGVFLAILILGSIGNGMVLMNVPIYLRMVIKGAILILAVTIDSLRGKKR